MLTSIAHGSALVVKIMRVVYKVDGLMSFDVLVMSVSDFHYNVDGFG